MNRRKMGMEGMGMATDYHKEGQKDAAKGKYNPPAGMGLKPMGASKQTLENQKAYDAGYKHGKSQK